MDERTVYFAVLVGPDGFPVTDEAQARSALAAFGWELAHMENDGCGGCGVYLPPEVATRFLREEHLVEHVGGYSVVMEWDAHVTETDMGDPT